MQSYPKISIHGHPPAAELSVSAVLPFGIFLSDLVLGIKSHHISFRGGMDAFAVKHGIIDAYKIRIVYIIDMSKLHGYIKVVL